MFEFKFRTSQRVEPKLLTMVRTHVSFFFFFFLLSFVLDLNPVWDQIIYVPGKSSASHTRLILNMHD